MLPAVVGAVLALLTAVVIFGGVHRISFITSVLVPIMAGIYILVGVYVTVTNLSSVPEMFQTILSEAFDIESIIGGFAGSTVLIGIKRGLFSNEAGMGSAPNASASAAVSHPVKQGLVQILSVFIDTLLICTTTAFILLLSNVKGVPGTLDGIPYVQAALQSSVGTWGIHFITFSIFAFRIHKPCRKLLLCRSQHSVYQKQSCSFESFPYHLPHCHLFRRTGKFFNCVESRRCSDGTYGSRQYFCYPASWKYCIPRA